MSTTGQLYQITQNPTPVGVKLLLAAIIIAAVLVVAGWILTAAAADVLDVVEVVEVVAGVVDIAVSPSHGLGNHNGQIKDAVILRDSFNLRIPYANRPAQLGHGDARRREVSFELWVCGWRIRYGVSSRFGSG